MNEMQDRLKYLLTQYANQTASPSEENELYELIGEAKHDNQIKSIMRHMMQNEKSIAELDKDRWEPVLKKVLAQQESNSRPGTVNARISTESQERSSRKRLYLKKWAVAASVLILFAAGWYILFSISNKLPSPVVKIQERAFKSKNNFPPGRNQAVLTLSDGSAINLDSVKNGILTKQGNTKIIKGSHGELLYHVDQQNSKPAGYNIVSTPRGGKYQIVLSDGSKVWLNAASSLKYPTSFQDKIRNVTLTGEGYFEVAKNASRPFQVTVNDMTVEVLGTHFNINAYSDEHSVATTLLEGSVKVTNEVSGNGAPQSVLLKPGEQADLEKDGNLKIYDHENIQQVIAWKENKFVFNNDAIPTIMRQVSRWYDVDVDFKASITTQRLTGKFSRNVNLGQLMEMLQYAGLNVKIENKTIIILETAK
ncbi:MAG: FecR family protein [Chitinophagaceae bacterium]